MPEITVRQEKIEVTVAAQKREFRVTTIPTATSGSWYVIHDVFEVWGAVAMDTNGSVIGWRNPPNKECRRAIEQVIRKTFKEDFA